LHPIYSQTVYFSFRFAASIRLALHRPQGTPNLWGLLLARVTWNLGKAIMSKRPNRPSKRSFSFSPELLERRVLLSSVVPTLGNVKLPPSAIAGVRLAGRVPVVLTNQGSAVKGDAITVNVYADLGTSLDGNQVLVKSTRRKVTLNTDKSAHANFIIQSLPSALPSGNYHLLAEVVDLSGATNVTATTQTVQVAAAFILPEVTVGEVAPSTIAQDKFTTVPITITNDGNVAASGVDIVLSPTQDGLLPLTGVVLKSTKSGVKIQPGKSKTFKMRFKVTPEVTAGRYFPDVSVLLGGVSRTKVGDMGFTVG